MVGRSTTKKLLSYGIHTIGELANANAEFLRSILGKNGEMLHRYANGLDVSRVCHKDEIRDIKSVGNSTTTPRDLVNDEDVKTVFTVLCESVARRLREQGVKGRTVTISVRDKNLHTITRQCKAPACTDISSEILKISMELFKINYNWNAPIRSLGVSVGDFDFEYCEQFDLSGTAEKREKLEKIESTVDNLKRRFGNYCIQRASMLKDTDLSRFNPHDEHTIHPVGFTG